jgi:hypothetical protein
VWCINLSNLATGVLWILVVFNFVVCIFHIFSVQSIDYWQTKLRTRVEMNEIDITDMKVDVEYLMKKEVK